jgi:hypothetical protein
MSLLKNLMVDTKSAWVSYPGVAGFEVEICSIPRAQLIKLRKSCTVTKFDRKSKMPIESLDEDMYVAEFTKAAIKNWKGLTLGKLEDLILVDLGGQDPATEVPFSLDDAQTLVSNSSDFDSWLTDAVFDLDHFRSTGADGAVEPTRKVAK